MNNGGVPSRISSRDVQERGGVKQQIDKGLSLAQRAYSAGGLQALELRMLISQCVERGLLPGPARIPISPGLRLTRDGRAGMLHELAATTCPQIVRRAGSKWFQMSRLVKGGCGEGECEKRCKIRT